MNVSVVERRSMSFAVVEAPLSDLERLTELALSEHELAQEAASHWFDHAVVAGGHLAAIRAVIPVGGWSNWIAENLGISRAVVHVYLKAHLFETEIRERSETSYRGVMRVSQELGLSIGERGVRPSATPEMKREVKAKADAGVSWRQIGSEMGGFHHNTVRCWVDPAFARDHYASKTAQRRQRDAAMRLAAESEERSARDLLARSAGGSIEKAYGFLRQALQQLDHSLRELPRERHAEVREAIRHGHKADDAITSVLRAERAS